jgi:G3E family GTPase
LRENQLPKVDAWLRSVLWESKLPNRAEGESQAFDIYRLKARLPLTDGNVKIVQGVREIFELRDAPENGGNEASPLQAGKIVVIGRDITRLGLEENFLAAVDTQ